MLSRGGGYCPGIVVGYVLWTVDYEGTSDLWGGWIDSKGSRREGVLSGSWDRVIKPCQLFLSLP